MNSITKHLKSYTRRSRLIIGLIVIALSFLILFALLPKTTSYLLARKNVFAQPYTTLKNEDFYRGNTKCIIDWYADNDKGRFYLAPVEDANGQSGFLSIYVPTKYFDQAEKVADQTWEYMENGDASVLVEEFSSRGYIADLSGTARSYLEQYLRQSNATQSMIDSVSNKIFVVLPFTDLISANSFFYLLLILLFVVLGIFMIITAFTGSSMKKFRNKLTDKHLTSDEIDADMVSAAKYGNIYIGEKYIVEKSLTPVFHVIEDIVWIHPEKTNSGNQTRYFADAYTRYHEKLQLSGKTESDSLAICNALKEKQPRALYGYVIENSTLYYSHFNELLDMVYNQGGTNEASEESVTESSVNTQTEPAFIHAPVGEAAETESSDPQQDYSSWQDDPMYNTDEEMVPMENVFKPKEDPQGSERSDDL